MQESSVQQLQRVASDLDSTHLLSALDVLDDFLGSRAWTEDLAFSIEEREVVVRVRWISSLLQHSVRSRIGRECLKRFVLKYCQKQ